MLSQRTKYALKALMSLADEAVREDGDPLTIEEIARRSGTPKRFLEHILLELRNAGYISSRRGRAGGYVLIKDPKAISLGDAAAPGRRPDRAAALPVAPGLPALRRLRRTRRPAGSASCSARSSASYLLLIESLTLDDLVRRDGIVERILPQAEAAGRIIFS